MIVNCVHYRFEKAAQLLRQHLPATHKDVMTADQMIELTVLFNTNAHSLPDIQGSGLFLLGSLIEHNCEPNIHTSSTGTTLFVHAIDAISKGDSIAMSYTRMYMPTSVRQQHLLNYYGFKCACKKCSDPDTVCDHF